MTREEYRAGAEDVIYLAACMINGEKPDAERVRQMDASVLYKVADHHLLTGVTGYALEAADVRDSAFIQAKSKAIRKIVLLDAERAAVLAELEKAGIWYMPMKGAVLKNLYPRIGMRQMSDNDILIDESRRQDVRMIMESLGFTHDHIGPVHDAYRKEPLYYFEMHYDLFSPSRQEFYSYFTDIKPRLIKDTGNQYGYHFRDEDYYIYMIAHEYKHYSSGGTGLRSLLDTYVYCRAKAEALDWSYIAGELTSLGIADFEARNRGLAMRLFAGEALTEADESMLRYILSSGTYGTQENSIRNKICTLDGGVRGKVKYLFGRVFLPLSVVQSGYPFFYKHKLLLPFLVVYRIGKGLTFQRKMVQLELRTLFKTQR